MLQTSRQGFAVRTLIQAMIDLPAQRRVMAGRLTGRGMEAPSVVAFVGVPELVVMRSKQRILGLVYPGGEIRRPPLVGMQFLHERAVGPSDFVAPRSRLQAKDLIGLLLGHFAARRRAALPPCRISLRVLTPSGKPAVQIAFK